MAGFNRAASSTMSQSRPSPRSETGLSADLPRISL
jgi:hypothetical protein